MQQIYKERKYKIDRIIGEYNNRKTQQEIADLFGMSIKEVAFVTQNHNYCHTRKIDQENIREGEYINPIILYDNYQFLDKYSIAKFQK